MLFPKKLSPPMYTGETRNDVAETSEFVIARPSATIVPLPMMHMYGCSWRTSRPKFDPVCMISPWSYPSQRR